MNWPSTAREALLAEALGDLAQLLERADALPPVLNESRRALVESQARLAEQLAAFDAHVIALAHTVKMRAVQHILARTEEAAQRSVDTQSRAMTDAAQALFKAQLEPTLQRLAMPLKNLVQRLDRPWEQWLTHAATAAVASAATWVLALYVVLPR
jgi:hypothetical protein